MDLPAGARPGAPAAAAPADGARRGPFPRPIRGGPIRLPRRRRPAAGLSCGAVQIGRGRAGLRRETAAGGRPLAVFIIRRIGCRAGGGRGGPQVLDQEPRRRQGVRGEGGVLPPRGGHGAASQRGGVRAVHRPLPHRPGAHAPPEFHQPQLQLHLQFPEWRLHAH
uniref:Uncharacterized protein n=1 Tax=Arundo donax TaxID=35708 RepID=A0A0A9CPA0_ARUDO